MTKSPAKLSRVEMEAQRMRAAEMLKGGQGAVAVAKKLGVTKMAVYRWVWALRNGSDLRRTKAPGRPSRLTPGEVMQLRDLWKTQPRWTSKRFAKEIERSCGVKYHVDHVLRLMYKLGLRVPKKRVA